MKRKFLTFFLEKDKQVSGIWNLNILTADGTFKFYLVENELKELKEILWVI